MCLRSFEWDDSSIPTRLPPLTLWNRMKHMYDEWPGDEEYSNFLGSRKCSGYVYYSFSIYSPMGKGSYGRMVHAPEVGVTWNNFDIYDVEIV